MRRFFALLCGLTLAGFCTAWAKGRKPQDYPRYEPPPVEALPSDTQVPAKTEVPSSDAAPEPAVPIVSQPPSPLPAGRQAPPLPEGEGKAPDLLPPGEGERSSGEGSRSSSAPLKHYSVWIWQDNGDCLWRIAEKVYGDRDKWKLIYLANRDIIKDPNKIYPKQTLKIPPADWQPDGN